MMNEVKDRFHFFSMTRKLLSIPMNNPEKSSPETDQAGTSEKASALTRRQWFLRLGETVALAGFSGVAGEELPAVDAQAVAIPEGHTLPPGLYDPSGDHMKHVLFRDDPFIIRPPGSETEYARPHPHPFNPAFFSHDDFQIVRRLAALMLNAQGNAASAGGIAAVRTETSDEIAEWIDLVVSEAAGVREAAKRVSAQHRALAVTHYGEEAVRQLETGDPQATWREGLASLKQKSEERFGEGFVILTGSQQAEILSAYAESSPDEKIESAGTRLYRLLKNQTVEGYYTSQAGLKELDYKGNTFYAESPGCPEN
jgi:Gluconate 2-dehydrogenase subunit 3